MWWRVTVSIAGAIATILAAVLSRSHQLHQAFHSGDRRDHRVSPIPYPLVLPLSRPTSTDTLGVLKSRES